MSARSAIAGPFLPPGTRVRYDGLAEGGPECGIVVHCWIDEASRLHDCHVAFFGRAFPHGRPTEKPCVLRYSTTSLVALGDDTP